MKKKAITIVAILIFVIILVGVIPFPRNINIKETAFEYSLSDKDVAIPHEVFIEGTYYTKLFGKDRFSGTFYISDVKNLDAEMRVDFEFDPRFRYYHPQFRVPMQLPRVTEIGVIFFDRNFKTLALQLAYEYRETEDGGTSASWRDDKSNFIIIGTANRDDALSTYQKLLEEKE